MKGVGIYIHIPFCQKKCKYCDFISFDQWDETGQQRYGQAVLKEIEECKVDKEVTSIYFGGGTPSIFPVEWLERILQKINEKWEVNPKAEITLELNPGTVDKKKLEFYQKIGINRLSIGLQSTHNRLLEMLGRVHCYEDFLKVYEAARSMGFNNINVDLMLGLPTQTLAELKKSLMQIILLNPEHISLYSLILEEGTELEKLVLERKLEMVTEALERKMYWETKKILEKNGYLHYEISNFAKKGAESRHNLACWNQEEYVGFGVAAHSYVDNKRFSNTNYLEQYWKGTAKILQEEQTFEGRAKEYMMLGLRKIKGVSISEFEQKFQINPLFYFRFEISKLEEMGLIEVDLNEIRLTKKGLDLANWVFEEFV